MSTKLGQAATVPVATFASAPTGKAAVPVIAVTLPEHPGKAVDAPGLVGQQAGEELNGEVSDFYCLIFTTSISLGKGHGQHAVIKLQVRLRLRLQGMTNGPIRAKQVNRSSSVIG